MASDVIGILGFALHAAHKVYKIVQTIKGAPDEMKALQMEANRVRELLSELIDAVNASSKDQSSARTSSHFRALVDEARRLTEAANKFVDKATTTKADGSYEVKKIKWVRYSSEGKALAAEFKGFYLSLCAVFSVNTS